MNCDILLLCPFGIESGAGLLDHQVRTGFGIAFTHILEAKSEFHAALGYDLSRSFYSESNKGEPILQMHDVRSSTAMTLATHFERAGLSWRVLDPGAQQLYYWRTTLKKYAQEVQPMVVGISTTFLTSPIWTRSLVRVTREAFPSAKIIVGGYMYGTDPKLFLSLDADIFVVGEGEIRLPEIVRRLKDNEPLGDIAGIYFREGEKLRYTGPSAQLSMSDLPTVNWELANRIDPPITFSEAPVQAWIETQRGCVFKCEFCTYRTISSPELMSVEAAAHRIIEASRAAKNGYVYVADATATFPRKRWEQIMEKVIELGGSKRPIWAYARVTDINEEVAELMAKAGVAHILIGQESGDQRMLDVMKKATRVEHVRPAIEALGNHGLKVLMSFIHGFPGETLESIENTRNLIATVNDDFKDRPVVLSYFLNPFTYQAFAAVSKDNVNDNRIDKLGYVSNEVTDDQMVKEYFKTVIAVSKIPHAPLAFFLLGTGNPTIPEFDLSLQSNLYEIYKLAKAYERGIAIFLEHQQFGVPVPEAELEEIKAMLVAAFGKTAPRVSPARHKIMRRLVPRLRKEWI
ncbi:MAG TPA: radical SAM protein, partial [Blastocatellia bacterium]